MTTPTPAVAAADPARVQYLFDRLDIQDTIARYALGQDGNQGRKSDLARYWDDVFTADGTVDFSAEGGPVGPYADLITFMRGDGTDGFLNRDYANWQHMMSLPLVTIDGDTARARTDILVNQFGHPRGDRTTEYLAAGAFHDELVRTPEGWRIRFRRFEAYSGSTFKVTPLA